MYNEKPINASIAIDNMVESINYFRKVINGVGYVDANKLYEKIMLDSGIFKTLIDEIMKKTSFEVIYEIYKDLYLTLIPYFKEVLVIDNIDFRFHDTLEDDHTLSLDIYIEDKYYGILNPINQTYKLPNINRIKEIEKRIEEITPEYQKIDEELTEIALDIKNPKRLDKKDKNLAIKRMFNKKSVEKDLKNSFLNVHNKKMQIEQEIAELTNEYEEYQNNIMTGRFYDEKLNSRLQDRLYITVDNSFKFNDNFNKEDTE